MAGVLIPHSSLKLNQLSHLVVSILTNDYMQCKLLVVFAVLTAESHYTHAYLSYGWGLLLQRYFCSGL